MILFRYNNIGHIASLYAKMKNAPFTEYDLHRFSPAKFPHVYRNRETLNRLVANKILSKTSKGWMITPFGEAHLRSIAKPYRGE